MTEKKHHIGISLTAEEKERLKNCAKNAYQSQVSFVLQATIERIKREETANE